MSHITIPKNRREFLSKSGGGFGALALAGLLNASHAAEVKNQLHHTATAKRVIFLFMEGGPSHLDLFDRKPLLNELAGQRIPDSFGKVITSMGEMYSPLLPSKREWKQHGESGLWVSDWLPHIAQCADDLAVIRSCYGEGINHSAGVCQMNSCSILSGRPSLGSWVSYGLGTENENLPAFVVMQDNPTQVVNGPRNWSAGFMPAVYQGTRLSEGSQPIAYLNAPEDVTPARQSNKLDYLNSLNRKFADLHPEQSELEARIASYELAYHMQSDAPQAVDISDETPETLELYGINDKATSSYGRMCLLGRRLAERGVRFIQLYSGSGSKWDSHDKIEINHANMCQSMDKPVAGLLLDLKRRGMLDDTLVVWGGEFGRTPMSEKGDGRDHNSSGFTMWMAGGGVRGGQTIGETDDLGFRATVDRQHVHDIHASILHLMGIDNMQMIYNHQGRPERPTVNEGQFCKKLVT
jgi:hypothetical protein